MLAAEFSGSGLNRTGYVRPGKLFTANDALFRRSVGKVTEKTRLAVVDTVILLLRSHK